MRVIRPGILLPAELPDGALICYACKPDEVGWARHFVAEDAEEMLRHHADHVLRGDQAQEGLTPEGPMIEIVMICSACDVACEVVPCPGDNCLLIVKSRHHHYRCVTCGYPPFVVSMVATRAGDVPTVTMAGDDPKPRAGFRVV